MEKRYYNIIIDGYDKGGLMYAPSDWPFHPIILDGEDIMSSQQLVLELRDGPYRHFNSCVGGGNIVSKDFMDTILPFITPETCLEFLPVKVVSQEYGDKEYYIMHFTKIHDVINKDATLYVPGTDSIVKLRLDNEKVKELDVFNSQPYVNDVIVSKRVCNAIKKNHLDVGIEFVPVYCEK